MQNADRSPSYSMPEVSKTTVLDKINAVLAARRALDKAVSELGDTWAADLSTRNRPNRQKLTAQLVEQLPKPLAFGKVIDAILNECEIET